MADVADYAHDRAQLTGKPEPFSDWVLLPPISAGHGLVDDDHERGVLAVGGCESTSATNRNSDGLEVSGTHGPILRHVVDADWQRRPSFDEERPGVVGSAQREVCRHAGRLDARYVPDTIEQLPLKNRNAPGARIPGFGPR